MKTGIELIAEERAKHESQGWTLEHDKSHEDGLLAMMAADLAVKHTDAWIDYPYYRPDWGLRERDTIERLAIAGSLIAAEIDRLQAMTKNQPLNPVSND